MQNIFFILCASFFLAQVTSSQKQRPVSWSTNKIKYFDIYMNAEIRYIFIFIFSQMVPYNTRIHRDDGTQRASVQWPLDPKSALLHYMYILVTYLSLSWKKLETNFLTVFKGCHKLLQYNLISMVPKCCETQIYRYASINPKYYQTRYVIHYFCITIRLTCTSRGLALLV